MATGFVQRFKGKIVGVRVIVQQWLQTNITTTLTAVGTTRATGLALTAQSNIITTAAASTGVVLPSAALVGIGGWVDVFNAGANAIKVYAAGTDTIDTIAGATGVTLTNAKTARFFVEAALTWRSAQWGAVSS